MSKINRFYKNIINKLENKFFKVSKVAGNYIYGTLKVSHIFNETYICRDFKICIKLYNNKFCSCYEINNEIPKNYHHHTASEDLILKTTSLCLAPNGEIKSFLQKEASLDKFIDVFIIPYFYNFSYYDKFGIEMWKGYSHGKNGIKEYYLEKLNIKEEKVLIKIMELIQKNMYFFDCPCGSGKKFSNCHQIFIEDIPDKVLKNDSLKFYKNIPKLKWNMKKKAWK